MFQQAEAALLAETDIKVFVVGVGNVNIDELRFITSKPEYVFPATSYGDMGAEAMGMLSYFCRSKWQHSDGLLFQIVLRLIIIRFLQGC